MLTVNLVTGCVQMGRLTNFPRRWAHTNATAAAGTTRTVDATKLWLHYTPLHSCNRYEWRFLLVSISFLGKWYWYCYHNLLKYTQPYYCLFKVIKKNYAFRVFPPVQISHRTMSPKPRNELSCDFCDMFHPQIILKITGDFIIISICSPDVCSKALKNICT